MANGIMDTLTNIRTEGTGVPMADPNMIAQMAPPPQGPMMDPQMGGVDPVAELMAAQQGGQAPMDDSMSVEGDAAMLAETVVDRTQGDIYAAVNILDTAKAMLVEGAGAPPQGGQGPIMAKDGAYLYRQEGGTMSDTDTLRAMIMANLQGQEGRTLSDRDIGQQGRTLSDADLVQLLDDIRITKGN
jgi:hypothetical protein|tara:strand:+ start:17394 stop:17951 length:558 start_codon:yes stop_codon:yes gene_type:complete